MNINVIVTTARSLTIELQNQSAFYSEQSYDLYLNGVCIYEKENKNVISIFGLEPATDYKIELLGPDKKVIANLSTSTSEEYVRLNVMKFGAKGDGIALDSIAIQAAILACPQKGTVYIPKGEYLCTPLFLKSHITIELEEGATLFGHTDRSLYPILPGYIETTDEKDEYYLGTWEGNPLNQFAGLITGLHVRDVAIIGRGILNGNGQQGDWWIDHRVKRGAWRPRTIYLNGCESITVQGVTIMNSPSWTIHPYFSKKLKFVDLSVINPKDSPNTDGLDPESCSDVDIIGVHFSVGDDCIAIKAGKLYMGRRLKQPSERFEIRNCKMQHGHGAVVIGSEMSGGVKEIHVDRCIFEKTDRGLRIKTRRGRGKEGVIDQITFENIIMNDVLTPFVMNMFYFCDPDGKTEYVWSKEALPVDEWTPRLGRFRFDNIICNNCEVSAGYFRGLPEQPIDSIHMKNIYVHFKEVAEKGYPAMMSFIDPMSKQGIFAEYVNELILDHVKIEGNLGDVITTDHVNEVSQS